jgi:hypothetical protein
MISADKKKEKYFSPPNTEKHPSNIRCKIQILFRFHCINAATSNKILLNKRRLSEKDSLNQFKLKTYILTVNSPGRTLRLKFNKSSNFFVFPFITHRDKTLFYATITFTT